MSTTLTEQNTILQEANAAKVKAETLLRRLLAAREETNRRLKENDSRDPLEAVTGKSALDKAIDTTRELVRKLNSHVAESTEHCTEETSSPISVNERVNSLPLPSITTFKPLRNG